MVIESALLLLFRDLSRLQPVQLHSHTNVDVTHVPRTLLVPYNSRRGRLHPIRFISYSCRRKHPLGEHNNEQTLERGEYVTGVRALEAMTRDWPGNGQQLSCFGLGNNYDRRSLWGLDSHLLPQCLLQSEVIIPIIILKFHEAVKKAICI